MSRFFRAGSDSESSEDDYSDDSVTDQSETDSDSSDSSSGSDSDSDSDSDAGAGANKAKGPTRWLKDASSGSDSDSDSDDSDDEKKAIKSARDKRFDEMRNAVAALGNAKKISDWVAIQNEFDRLVKSVTKSAALIEREGTPRFFVRTLVELDDFLKDSLQNKDAAKKMNAITAKALNAMKQKIKKITKTYETQIEKFRENPVDAEESETEALEQARAQAQAAAAAPKQQAAAAAAASEAEAAKDGDKGFTVVGKSGKAVEYTPEQLFAKLAEVNEARGKKSTDKLAQIEILSQLLASATTPYQKIRVLLSLIPSRFDFVPPTTGFMSADMWNKALGEIKTLLGLLDANEHITLTLTPTEQDESVPEHMRDRQVTAGQPVVLPGHIASFVDRLDDEFTKSLQNIDPHTTEYIDRLRDETALYATIVRVQKYSEATGATAESHDLMVMRRLEHLYNKPDSVIKTVEEEVRKIYPKLVSTLESPVELVSSLCTGLYKTKIDRIRTRALLCHVYHLALHDQYYQARDLILMSHVQETIVHADIEMQILYNRTIVQIGMCAFRSGLFREAAATLQDISSSGKTKELLAQGMQGQKYGEKTAEQERLERQRQLPFHMHVNLELLECVYLTSAMLLEIPNIALHVHDSRRKTISKSFRRMLDFSDRLVFAGPPESVRDHIMAASKAMAAGEWKQCRDFINAIKIWDLLPNVEKTKEMLARSIQEETLRTYIFTYSPFYESLGLESLSVMFELPETVVTAIVSKMIMDEVLHASLDHQTRTIVLHRPAPGVEMSRLEFLASTYADKVTSLVDTNEKLLESRSITLGLQEQQHQMQQGASGAQRGAGRRLGGSSRAGNSGQSGARSGAGSAFRFRTVVGK
ncbi:Translation initiation factor 3 subunit c [Polyrhizophydium stewartii]|uniref:Eukaryotic translation initiation factor 3 subunit C n=1 Tax=Polyrhizophydium stewartii TaxID=2732419 RepID=A0ABR4NIN4_9FUNG